MVTAVVEAFRETITWIFFVWPLTVAAERMVASLDAGEPCVTLTEAVELPEVNVYGTLILLPVGNCGLRSSCNSASSAPAVAVDSALNAAATPYPASNDDAAKNAMSNPATMTIPPINNTTAKNV